MHQRKVRVRIAHRSYHKLVADGQDDYPGPEEIWRPLESPALAAIRVRHTVWQGSLVHALHAQVLGTCICVLVNILHAALTSSPPQLPSNAQKTGKPAQRAAHSCDIGQKSCIDHLPHLPLLQQQLTLSTCRPQCRHACRHILLQPPDHAACAAAQG